MGHYRRHWAVIGVIWPLLSKGNDKPTVPNTLTIVGCWNSETISLFLKTYLSCLFLHCHLFRQGFELVCICCSHVRERNDKPTTRNALTIVGGWSSAITQFNCSKSVRHGWFVVSFTHVRTTNAKRFKPLSEGVVTKETARIIMCLGTAR